MRSRRSSDLAQRKAADAVRGREATKVLRRLKADCMDPSGVPLIWSNQAGKFVIPETAFMRPDGSWGPISELEKQRRREAKRRAALKRIEETRRRREAKKEERAEIARRKRAVLRKRRDSLRIVKELEIMLPEHLKNKRKFIDDERVQNPDGVAKSLRFLAELANNADMDAELRMRAASNYLKFVLHQEMAGDEKKVKHEHKHKHQLSTVRDDPEAARRFVDSQRVPVRLVDPGGRLPDEASGGPARLPEGSVPRPEVGAGDPEGAGGEPGVEEEAEG